MRSDRRSAGSSRKRVTKPHWLPVATSPSIRPNGWLRANSKLGGTRHWSGRLRRPRGRLTAGQKSAEGVLGQAVGKASEALQGRKAEQQIGQAGNDGRRPERLGVASRTGDS